MPPHLTNIECVKCTKLLVVYIMDNLGVDKEMYFLLKICNQRLYLLNQIKKRGSSKTRITPCFQRYNNISCHICCCFEGFATAAECNAIQAFLNKVKRWGIISDDRSIDDIFDEIDYGSFKKIRLSHHHIFPYACCSPHGMKMRKRGHN